MLTRPLAPTLTIAIPRCPDCPGFGWSMSAPWPTLVAQVRSWTQSPDATSRLIGLAFREKLFCPTTGRGLPALDRLLMGLRVSKARVASWKRRVPWAPPSLN